MGSRPWAAAVVVAVMALAPAARTRAADVVLAPDSSGTPEAREAIDLCLRAAAQTSAAERQALLDRGLDLAEHAVSTAEGDPKAHFAVFCNLGRKLESEGAGLASVAQVERMKREIDRALELAPGFVDALAGKGAMLVRLPALMGGDEDEGERLIRRAVALAPEHPAARLELAKALAARGDDTKALHEARDALVLARRQERPAELREARELAAELES